MSLADQIAADVSTVFLNTADFAVSVTVTRSTESTEPIVVIIGASQFQVSTEFGFMEFETRDFIFDPSKYDFGHGPVLPHHGDLFFDAGFTYVATNPNQNTNCYAFDETRQLITVHTIRSS